ncbi:hypothetical protein P0Y35_15955 [Kiritimatiellaeota bacterium B1221]|nr:hypothetical protein [Kiritimatiellaeota bacterium B1221]
MNEELPRSTFTWLENEALANAVSEFGFRVAIGLKALAETP